MCYVTPCRVKENAGVAKAAVYLGIANRLSGAKVPEFPKRCVHHHAIELLGFLMSSVTKEIKRERKTEPSWGFFEQSPRHCFQAGDEVVTVPGPVLATLVLCLQGRIDLMAYLLKILANKAEIRC